MSGTKECTVWEHLLAEGGRFSKDQSDAQRLRNAEHLLTCSHPGCAARLKAHDRHPVLREYVLQADLDLAERQSLSQKAGEAGK